MLLDAIFRSRRLTPGQLGARGERRAAWFYRLRGYRVVARNLRTRAGEADLVVRRGRVLAVVEVKTRGRGSRGEGWEAVDRAKRERMFRIGESLLAQHGEVVLRYDIVSLAWDGRRFALTHYADAFRPVADARYPWVWRG